MPPFCVVWNLIKIKKKLNTYVCMMVYVWAT